MSVFLLASAYGQEDLDIFFSNFKPYITNGIAPILRSTNGEIAPVDVAHTGSEASLNLEFAIPLVYPQQTTIYQVDDEVDRAMASWWSHPSRFFHYHATGSISS
jgi:tripeptidyl-peptidase-1